MNKKNNQEIYYHLLKILSKNPNFTQRQMAKEMGISLGKFNYCLAELVKKGFVKVKRFKSSDNKAAYMYILTPHGMEEKIKITTRFLKTKLTEYDYIKMQLTEIAEEIVNDGLTES